MTTPNEGNDNWREPAGLFIPKTEVLLKAMHEGKATIRSPEDMLAEENAALLARIEELEEGYRLILRSPCCPGNPTHGNACPGWIAREALKVPEYTEEAPKP